MDHRRITLRHALIGVVATWYLLTSAIFGFSLLDPHRLEVLSGLSLTAAALIAGATCLNRSRSVLEPRTRAAWQLLGCAATAWGLGQVVTCYYELVLDQATPFPSMADLGYLLTVPLFAAGLLYLAVPANQMATRTRAVLDGLLISFAVLLSSWVTVLGPIAHSSSDSWLNKIILLAYPVGDVALVTLVAYVLLRVRATGVRPAVPLGLIAVALGGFAVADSGYAYLSLVGRYASGNPIDSGWLGGFTVLFVAAVVAPRRSELPASTPETRPLGMLLPYFFIVVATALTTVIHPAIGRTDGVTKSLRTAMILLMVIRQVLTLLENRALTRTLEGRVDDRTAELESSKERFRALVEHSSDVVSLIRPSGEIIYQSDSSLRIFGRDSAELLDRPFADLLDEPSRAQFATAVAEAALSPLRTGAIELRLMHGDGAWRQVETTVTNLLAEPAVQALVLNTRDVSERRELEDQLVHQAFHDSLTSLANRALFLDRVRHAMTRRSDSSETDGRQPYTDDESKAVRESQ